MSSRKINKSLNRKWRTKDANLIVIAVEGEKTENEYFNIFNDYKVKIEILPNNDGKPSPKGAKQRLDKYKKDNQLKLKSRQKDGKADQLWMVVDVDRYKKIISKIYKDIKECNYQIAISNPCFEIWLYLHIGNIKIKNDKIIFTKDDKLIEEINIDKLSSRKMKQILSEVNRKIPNSTGYKNLYLRYVKKAIEKSKKLNRNLKDKELLLADKGKTSVNRLVEEIMKK